MPGIPTYERGPGVDTVRGVVPHASGAAPIAQGLADISRGMGQLDADLQRQQAERDRQDKIRKLDEEKQAEERAKVWAGQATGQNALTESQILDQSQRKAPAGADGFANSYIEDFDKRAAAVIEAAPDAPSKRLVTQHLQAQRLHFGQQAQDFQFRAGDADAVNRHTASVETWSKVVEQDPRQYSVAMRTLTDTMPDVVPEKRQKLLDNISTSLTAAAGFKLLQEKPALLYDLTARALNIKPEAALPPDAAAGAPGSSFTPVATDARGVRNNNPGNIRLPAPGARGDSWIGQVAGQDTAFVTFDSPQSGIRAMAKNLLSYQDGRGINTVQGIVGRWAPASENDTPSYVKAVSSALGVKSDQPLDLRDPGVMQGLVGAMIAHENGKNPYPTDVVKQGVAAGLGLSQLNPRDPPPVPVAPQDQIDLADGKPLKTGVSWIDNASVDQLVLWRQKAHTEMQRTLAVDRTALASKVKDFQSMVLSGVAPPSASVPSPGEYARVYGPGSGHQFESEVADYQRTGDALRKLQTASAGDRAAIINGAAPVPGPDFDNRQRLQGALMQANALIEKQIVADPALYAAQNAPKVRDAWAAMQKVQGDSQASDVEKRSASITFAQTTMAEQERLGVNSIKGDVLGEAGKNRGPRLLTNGQANDIAAQFSKKPADAAQLIDALQKQWGGYFPQVYGQLARDDKLPPAALVIPNMSDPYAKEQLARISDPKVQKELKDALPAGAEKDLTAKLQSLNEPFFTSLMYQEGGIQTHAIVSDQQKALASSYVAQGKSIGDAAKLAFQQTVGWQYSFDNTMRIPTKEVPEVVKAGTGMVLTRADMLDVAVPPSFRQGLKDADRKAAWVDAIRHGATFVTNGDETGLMLHVSAKTDAGQDALFAVRQSDGSTPLSWSWSQLRDLGAAALKARTDALQAGGAFGSAQRSRVLQDAAEQDRQRRLREMGLR